MSDLSQEVRRCHACGETKVLLATNWKHTTWGVDTHQSTRDYRCQGCGKRFTIHAKTRQIALWIVGFLFLCPVGFGLPFLGLAYWRSLQDGRNPVVPGAPAPEVRYRMGPPLRRCGKCQGVCVVTAVTAHRHNGVPTGVDTSYQCTRCNQTFKVESWWGHMFSGCATLAIFLIAAACAGAGDSLAVRLGGGGLLVLAGLFMVWSMFTGIRAHFANPVDDSLIE